jgi:hypothetical protein
LFDSPNLDRKPRRLRLGEPLRMQSETDRRHVPQSLHRLVEHELISIPRKARRARMLSRRL